MSMQLSNSLILAAGILAATPHYATSFPIDTGKIETITGLKGKLDAKEGVFKITSPRSDVKIKVDGWTFPPFMGATSWVAYQPGKEKGAMIMGDLVLFQDEVNPVMSVLLEHRVDVTALHNHFFFDEPKVYYMHVGGEGSAEELSKGIRAALDKIKEIRGKHPVPANQFSDAPIPEKSAITVKTIEDIFGLSGDAKDGMFKVTIGRTVKMPCGCDVGMTMGVNTWAAFAGTDANTVVVGDFAVLESELQGVLKSLRRSNINVVTIHSHMTNEEPRMLFLHYWGRGKAIDLAKSVKAALGTQKN